MKAWIRTRQPLTKASTAPARWHGAALAGAGLIVLLGAQQLAHAQASNYPNKPIRIILPYSPGGNSDINARFMAKRFSDDFGVPAFVETKPGGSSIIGTEMVMRSAPDGYTLLFVGAGGTTHTTNPALFAKLPYDSVKDFSPISLFSQVSMLLFASPKLPANNVRELVALSKSRPGGLNAASGGDGTGSFLSAHLFKSISGANFQVINYKGNAPANTDTMGGQTDFMFDTISTVIPHIKAGRLKPLAVTSLQRVALAPDVPTVSESGFPGFEMGVYLGVLGPANMPRDVVNKLAGEIAKITRDPEARKQFSEQGVELVSSTPEEFTAFLRADIERWQKIIKDAGIKQQ
jgi:tripartite-type tricarboxylate transporter receptor subunit TctC